jgi:hypothetical protein
LVNKNELNSGIDHSAWKYWATGIANTNIPVGNIKLDERNYYEVNPPEKYDESDPWYVWQTVKVLSNTMYKYKALVWGYKGDYLKLSCWERTKEGNVGNERELCKFVAPFDGWYPIDVIFTTLESTDKVDCGIGIVPGSHNSFKKLWFRPNIIFTKN